MADNLNALKDLLSNKDIAALARRGIKPGGFIGSGSYGTIYWGWYFRKQFIAIKKLDMMKSGNVPSVLMEMLILKKIRHPYVVRVIDFYLLETQELLIFMELLNGGDLCDLLYDKKNFKEVEVAKFYGQFGSGLAFMHNRGFAHRDLKPANILLTEDKTVAKLCDFGLSQQGYDIYTGKPIKVGGYKGTLQYMSPQVMNFRVFSKHNRCYSFLPAPYCPFLADIWSMGIIVFEMLHGSEKYPYDIDFNHLSQVDWQEASKQIRMVPKMLSQRFNPELQLSDAVKNFIACHLKLKPTHRLDMDQLLEDKWIVINQKIDEKADPIITNIVKVENKYVIQRDPSDVQSSVPGNTQSDVPSDVPSNTQRNVQSDVPNNTQNDTQRNTQSD